MSSLDYPSVCAILGVRNEYHYLKVLLPLLAEQTIDVVIIDNDSNDGSHDLYRQYSGKPIIGIERLPFRGVFSLSEQLEAKKVLCDRLNHDWVIHQDADEILQHWQPNLSLYDAIAEAHRAGYNVLNFDEFVFLPEPGETYEQKNYYQSMLRYYFFEPMKNRLNLAWKRSANLSNFRSGGHRLEGESISIYPRNCISRHYIVLSESFAQRKYLRRIVSERDLSLGWHSNRHNLTAVDLVLPHSSKYLYQLETYESKAFYRGMLTKKHYWHWPSDSK